MDIRMFLKEHWFIVLIIAVVAAICLRVAYTKSELYYYRNYIPTAYCEKYPDGKYKEKALEGIINSLYTDLGNSGPWTDFHFDIYFAGSEKKLSEFTQKYSTGKYRERFETLCSIYYLRLRNKYWDTIEPGNLERLKSKVEEKYHNGIEQRKSWLERQWRDEKSAWEIASRDSVYIPDAIDALRLYLQYHPRGAHALEAYELKDELYEMLQENED